MPLTGSEAYLAKLAARSFLSMSSDPNPDFGTPGNESKGKELCDLMVVFDNTVILFSDKDCQSPSSGDSDLDWTRCYNHAVSGSVKQLRGAKRTLSQQPEKIHTDLILRLAVPLELLDPGCMKIHLVAVAHRGVSCSWDGTVRLWDVTTGEEQAILRDGGGSSD